MHSYNEFEQLIDKVRYELYVTMNCANPRNHVTEIKKNNRRVKEIYHAKYYRLPFHNTHKVIIRYLDLN